MGMNLTNEDARVILLMADVFIEDGSYLLEETGECDLMRRMLKKYPDVAKECKQLTYFLEHGEPLCAKRATRKQKKAAEKSAKAKPVSGRTLKKKTKKKTKKKRATPMKTCPECGEKVHVRKCECRCGYVY